MNALLRSEDRASDVARVGVHCKGQAGALRLHGVHPNRR